MLTKSSYNEWSLIMKVKMQARQMWDAICCDDIDFYDDRRALEAILAAVPPEMAPTLADKETARDAIAASRICNDRVRRATQQRLRQEWDRLAFRASGRGRTSTTSLSASPAWCSR